MKNPDPLRNLRQECDAVLAQLEKLRAIKIKTAAELLDISEEQVRALLPIKVYGPKTHRVALSDIEALQSARTLQPWKASLFRRSTPDAKGRVAA